MKYLRFPVLSACMLVALVAGCSDDSDPLIPPQQPLYTISGTVRFKKPMTVPDSARFWVGWTVSSGSPDYGYVFGEGTVDFSSMTFIIRFDQAPPDSALNRYSDSASMGVGMMFFSTINSTFPRRAEQSELGAFYGAVSNTAIIYIEGKPVDSTQWPSLFKPGFNVGKGVDEPTGFDSFTPVEPTNLELLITDDPEDVTFPNWT